MPEPSHDAREALRLHLLVLRCQAGDERAFAQLMDRFGNRTLRYLRSLIGDGAEDVHHEVWLTVYRRIATLTDPRRFRSAHRGAAGRGDARTACPGITILVYGA